MEDYLKVRLISEHLPSVRTTLEQRKNKPEININSIPSLNRTIWGLSRQQLIVLGGRTSQGKSAFALQLAYDVAKQGKCVLFISLEMTIYSLIERLFCNEMEIDNEKLRKGGFVNFKEEWSIFEKKTQSLRMVITDSIGYTWFDIEKTLREFKTKPDLVVIDYIQSIKQTSREFREEMGEYIRQFRENAIKNNFVGILCSQINRNNQGPKHNEPYLHDLKGTGSLEELADMVMLLHYPCVYDDSKSENEYHVRIEKNRHGRVGFKKIKFEGKYTKFSDFNEKELEILKENESGRIQFSKYQSSQKESKK